MAALAGEGDVARYNIKLAASLSVGAARGVVCCRGVPPRPAGGDGVWVRSTNVAVGASDEGAAVLAED